MSTRRNAATALLGLPMLSGAAKIIEFDAVSDTPEPQQPSPLRSNPIKINFEQISEEAVRVISYTIYAEARGEPFPGQKAVASVIHTRSQQLKLSMPEVCLQAKQFSCWNSLSSVPSYYATGKGLRPADVQARSNCYGLAWLLISGHDGWDYLTHFYNPAKASPSWRRDMRGVRTIGNHVFGYIR